MSTFDEVKTEPFGDDAPVERAPVCPESTVRLSRTTYLVWSDDGAEASPDTWDRVLWWLDQLARTPRLKNRRVWVEAMERVGEGTARVVWDSANDDIPTVIRACPDCGAEVRHRPGTDDAIDECFECETIVEGCAVCVPGDVYEIGPETTLAWIKAHREGPHGAT